MSFDWLDIATTFLGLLYIWLEYRAHIALWLVGIVMPALDVYLYYSHGLYGDAGMAVYYTLAAFYGLIVWLAKPARRGADGGHRVQADAAGQEAPLPDSGGSQMPITHMPLRLYLPTAVFFFLAWGATYYVLTTWTNSTVPLLDSFTNALSFVGLWALARKYLEQWFFWMVVDAVCTVLYVQKGIPFKAGLYGLYVVIAVLGYFKWKKMAKTSTT
jgi:nicotinamide mononucleotide transporter